MNRSLIIVSVLANILLNGNAISGFISKPITFLQTKVSLKDENRSCCNMKSNHHDGEADIESFLQRRNFLSKITLFPSLLTSCSWNANLIQSSTARGLVKFPCKDYAFLNTYHFMRAGESLLEEEGIWTTNPLFLTNRESALSSKGIAQIEETCKRLKADDINPTVVRYSLAASSMDTTDIVGSELKIGRNSLVPEFNYMDPRAIGNWDMLPLATTQSAVWAMDDKEAGPNGLGARPPANEDSTPHETLDDQVCRLRQLLSVLETQYSGDTVLLVFPDGTGPSLLTCLIGGIPLNRVHEFEYSNGEVRLDINYKSAQVYLDSIPSEDYLGVIKNGEMELAALRDNNEILDVREQQYLEEQVFEEEKSDLMEEVDRMDNAKTNEEKEQERKEESLMKSSNSENIASIAAISGIGGIGAFAVLGPKGDIINSDENNITIPEAEHKDKNATMSSLSTEDVNEVVSIPQTLPAVDLSAIANEVVSIPQTLPAVDLSAIDIKSASDINIDNDDNNLSSWDPNEDDGGDAWLGSLNEIINEGEDLTSEENTE